MRASLPTDQNQNCLFFIRLIGYGVKNMQKKEREMFMGIWVKNSNYLGI